MTLTSDRQPAIALVDDDFHSARLMTRMLAAHGGPHVERLSDPDGGCEVADRDGCGSAGQRPVHGRRRPQVLIHRHARLRRSASSTRRPTFWSSPWRPRSIARLATHCSTPAPPRCSSATASSTLTGARPQTLSGSGFAASASTQLAPDIPQGPGTAGRACSTAGDRHGIPNVLPAPSSCALAQIGNAASPPGRGRRAAQASFPLGPTRPD